MVNVERARDVRKFCLRTQAVEGKIRARYSGICIQNILRMRTDCGECAAAHFHSDRERVNKLLNICIKLKSKTILYAEKAPVENQ